MSYRTCGIQICNKGTWRGKTEFVYEIILLREWHVLEELKHAQLCLPITLVQYLEFQLVLRGCTDWGLVCVVTFSDLHVKRVLNM